MSVCRAARDLTCCEPLSCYTKKFDTPEYEYKYEDNHEIEMWWRIVLYKYFWLYECEYFIDSRVSPKEENVGLCVAFYNSNSTGFRVMILRFTFLSIFQFNRNVLCGVFFLFFDFVSCFCSKIVSILNNQNKYGANSHQLFQSFFFS